MATIKLNSNNKVITKDEHICIALARADCYLRKLRYSVDQLTQLLEKY